MSTGAIHTSKESGGACFGIGLSLALSSSVFIGASFVIKKVALRRLSAAGGVRASAGGFAYLRQWLWWVGLATMGVGEAANLAALALVPAALVTPLGALSVLVAAVLAARFLNEHLHHIGKLGCVLCVCGATVVALHAPAPAAPRDPLRALAAPGFLAYAGAAAAGTLAARAWLVPALGQTHVGVYVGMCSATGSLTVTLCRAAALTVRAEGAAAAARAGLWLAAAAAAACVCVQMAYLNRALDAFGAAVVTPVYFVWFTALSLASSALALGEGPASAAEAAGAGAGLAVLAVAVRLVTSPSPDPRRQRPDCSLSYNHTPA